MWYNRGITSFPDNGTSPGSLKSNKKVWATFGLCQLSRSCDDGSTGCSWRTHALCYGQFATSAPRGDSQRLKRRNHGCGRSFCQQHQHHSFYIIVLHLPARPPRPRCLMPSELAFNFYPIWSIMPAFTERCVTSAEHATIL